MRIGIVTEYYRPWPGGISEHVHHEALALEARGHEVTIVTGPAKQAWRDEGVRVIRLPFAYEFESNGALSRMVYGRQLLTFGRLFRRERFDVIHAHAPLDPFLTLFALGAAECATVGTFHANFEPGPLWELIFRRFGFITGPVFRKLRGRIAVSNEARRSIAHYFPAEYEIIPNGVDTDRFSPEVPVMTGFETPRPRILFVGRSDPRKGLPILLRAFSEIHKRLPGAQLVVVGARAEELAAPIAALGAEAAHEVHFAGYVSPAELPRYFAACDVFCSPATGQESQGIVLLEAMAAGTPPVAFAIPGYRDVIRDGHDGVLVGAPEALPLADALTELLLDAGRLRRLAAAGRESAMCYSWPRVAERIEGVFERALGATGPATPGASDRA